MPARGYTQPMRMTLVAVVLAMAVAGGCAAEKKRVDHENQISAAWLGGKFRHDDPLVTMLSASERQALDRAGMLQEPPQPTFDADGNEILADAETGDDEPGDDDSNKSTGEKAGEVMMSVLAVIVPLGMAVAPYLLF